jgi:hypothetical protein
MEKSNIHLNYYKTKTVGQNYRKWQGKLIELPTGPVMNT